MIDIKNETRIKLNIIFAQAFLEITEKAKAGGPGLSYHEDEMGLDGFDYYRTLNGNGEVYNKANGSDLAFQHYGMLGDGKNFFVQAVTNEIPIPTEGDHDSFDVCTFEDNFNLNDYLKEIIEVVLNDIKPESLEEAKSILQVNENILGTAKLLLTKPTIIS